MEYGENWHGWVILAHQAEAGFRDEENPCPLRLRSVELTKYPSASL